MSTSVAARLRALARQHGEGQLSRDAYRKLRASLIDALEGPDALDSQSSTIPHLEPRIRGVRTNGADTAPSAATSAPPARTRRGPLGKMLAWVATVWRR
jgi:hypothetical protein